MIKSNKEIAENIYDSGQYFPGSDPNVTKEQVVAEIARVLDLVASGDYEEVEFDKDPKSFDVV